MSVPVSAGYWHLDLQSGELILCPRSRAMFGLDGRSPKRIAKSEWQPRIHLDDMPVIDRELQAARSGDGVYTARFRAVHPDGWICDIVGVGRMSAKEQTRFVGLNFDLVGTVETALQASRRPLPRTAAFATIFKRRSKAANENQLSRTPARHRDQRPGQWIAAAFERRVLVRRARVTIQLRRLRQRYLSPAMFGEPAFDMLLALYVANASSPSVSLRALSPLMGVQESTAERWLDFLVSEGLALKVAGHLPGPGFIHVALTEKGRTALDDYFKESNLV